jgi:hypothetical protein
VWTPDPVASGDAVCDGSLQILYEKGTKHHRNGTKKCVGPSYVDPGLWQELMEVNKRYGDLATWEMKSLSVGDGSLMLGVLIMASGKEKFQWKTCYNEDHGAGKKKHKMITPKQRMDCIETMVTLGLDDPTLLDQTSFQDVSDDDILDASLRQGGSSLDEVRTFDQKLMEDALEMTQPDFTSSDEKTSDGEETDTGSATDAEPEVAAEKPDARERTILKRRRSSNIGSTVLKSVVRNLSTNDPKSSLGGKLKSAPRKSSQGNMAGPSTKAKGLKVVIPFPLRRNPSPRKRVSKSSRKKGNNGEEAENKEPLTAQSIIQQVSQMLTTSLILSS